MPCPHQWVRAIEPMEMCVSPVFPLVRVTLIATGPAIDGLHDYRGILTHTANWDPSIDLKDKRVAVIGTGSSGIQLIPQIVKGPSGMLLTTVREPCTDCLPIRCQIALGIYPINAMDRPSRGMAGSPFVSRRSREVSNARTGWEAFLHGR